MINVWYKPFYVSCCIIMPITCQFNHFFNYQILFELLLIFITLILWLVHCNIYNDHHGICWLYNELWVCARHRLDMNWVVVCVDTAPSKPGAALEIYSTSTKQYFNMFHWLYLFSLSLSLSLSLCLFLNVSVKRKNFWPPSEKNATGAGQGQIFIFLYKNQFLRWYFFVFQTCFHAIFAFI